MKYRLKAIILTGIISMNSISACSVGESTVTEYVNLPPEFVVRDFQSARDLSSMHGPQYFTFACDSGEFAQISRLNGLTEIVDFPNQIEAEWRHFAKTIVETSKLEEWPSKEEIAGAQVFSNLGAVADRGEDSVLKFAIAIEGRAFFVVQTIDQPGD